MRALAKVVQVMPPRLRRRVEALRAMTVPAGMGRHGSARRPGRAHRARAACRDSERLEFGYTAADGGRTDRHVEPLRLVPLGRRWYLVAYDLTRHDWRSFRLDRLDRPRNTGARFRPRSCPPRTPRRSSGRDSGDLPTTTPSRCWSRIGDGGTKHIGRWADVEEADDGRCLLRMRADSLDWPRWPWGSLGAEFTVLSPPELVDHRPRVGGGRSAAPPVGLIVTDGRTRSVTGVLPIVGRARAGLAELADPVAAPGEMQRLHEVGDAVRGSGLNRRVTRLVRTLVAECPLPDAAALRTAAEELWTGACFREERYLALSIVDHSRYRRWPDPSGVPLLRDWIVTGAWWDFTDEIASRRIGPLLRAHPTQLTPVLRAWATDEDRWLRRTAVISQLGSGAATDLDLLRYAVEANLGIRLLPAQRHRVGAAPARPRRPGLGTRFRRRPPRALAALPPGSAQALEE